MAALPPVQSLAAPTLPRIEAARFDWVSLLMPLEAAALSGNGTFTVSGAFDAGHAAKEGKAATPPPGIVQPLCHASQASCTACPKAVATASGAPAFCSAVRMRDCSP